MPRVAVILLISWAYVGCSARGTSTVASPVAVAGAELRWVADRPTVAKALLAGAVGQRLRARGSASTTPVEPAECAAYGFDPPARDPRGVPVLPQDVIVEWESRLRDPASAASWLLSPIDGAAAFVDGRVGHVEGLRAAGDRLELCSRLPVPDLAARLAHPDLVHWRRDADGLAVGPGPFFESARGVFEPNPAFLGERPRPGRIFRVTDEDPAAGVERGAADAALAYGREAGRAMADPALEVRPAPGWERLLVLWMNPRARWLNDPRFRRWIAGQLDREGLLDLLFDGRGTVLDDLVDGSSDVPLVDPVGDRPVSRDSKPRFTLAHADGDPAARAVAARIKASLRTERVEVTLEAIGERLLAEGLRDGTLQAAVLTLEPTFEDPLLALRELAWRLGPSAEEAGVVLDQAAALDDPDGRIAAARAAESILVAGAVAVPLIRLDAWLVTRAGLVGVRVGPQGVLDLSAAGWTR